MSSNRTNEPVSHVPTPSEESPEADRPRAARSWDEAMYLMANPVPELVDRSLGSPARVSSTNALIRHCREGRRPS